ncbi:TPA: hypothetical protein ACGO2N_001358 [Streptococcus suis]
MKKYPVPRALMSEKVKWSFSACRLEMGKLQSYIVGLMTPTQFSIFPTFIYLPDSRS